MRTLEGHSIRLELLQKRRNQIFSAWRIAAVEPHFSKLACECTESDLEAMKESDCQDKHTVCMQSAEVGQDRWSMNRQRRKHMQYTNLTVRPNLRELRHQNLRVLVLGD